MRGLVLEGGGMRGVFTAGVLDAFLDLNIEFDHCVAISAGALNGVSFISKQKGRNLRVMRNYPTVSIKNWIMKGSIFDMEMLLEKVPEQLDPVDFDAYKKNSCKLYAGVFDIESGEQEFCWIEDVKRDKLYLQAAASLPLLSKIVHINGRKYLDGGIRDCFGLDFIKEKCDKVIVVNTRDKDYRRGEEKSLPLMKIVYHKYPKLIEYIGKRATNYNNMVRKLEQLDASNEIMLIRPLKKVNVSRTETDETKLLALYEEGYQLVMNKKEEILTYLQ